MVIKLDIKQKLLVRSKRVKNVDIHPTEPWYLATLFSGQAVITNYKTKSTVRSFDVGDVPVRAGKFIARKNWIICGSDDMQVRVYDYNTAEKVAQFTAHNDYIRSIAVHPTKPYVLTCSDDATIKMWDWENKWQCVRVFEGHTYFVMMVNFSTKDPNVFASASLDGTIRVWNINKPTPSFTLSGHTEGVNCVDFYHGDKPFLISGSDDSTVKIWDYQTRSCVQTLEGHTDNVTAAVFHPKLGYIISVSEDHTTNIWNASTYQLEDSFNSGLDRAWHIGYNNSTNIVIGYDEGSILLRLGKESPIVTMDKKGKVIWIRNGEVEQISIKHTPEEEAALFDGEKLVFPPKEKGVVDVNAQRIAYSPKGNYIYFSGEDEWVIYSPVTMKNKCYGSGVEIVWGPGNGQFAVRERSGKIKIYKSWKEAQTLDTFLSPTGIFGGTALGVKSKDLFCLYDWDTGAFIQSIELSPKSVYWSESGNSFVIADDSTWFVLNLDQALIKQVLKSGAPESGIDNAVSVEAEFSEKLKRGYWNGDCFIFTTSDGYLKYYISGSCETIATLTGNHFLLGYLSKYNRIYLLDKEYNVISYSLHVSVIQYEAAIIAGDLEGAAQFLTEVPKEFHNKIAQFLDRQGKRELKEIALGLTNDPEQKFQLAIELGRQDIALEIAEQESSDEKWKQVGGIALTECKFDIAEKCFLKGKDFSGLLLLYTCTGNAEGVKKLAEITRNEGKNNISMVSNFLTNDMKGCLDILVDTNRLPEAAVMAINYAPSQTSSILHLWKKDLEKVSERAAESLADPEEYPNLFPDYNQAKSVEERYYESLAKGTPASEYPTLQSKRADRNILQEFSEAA